MQTILSPNKYEGRSSAIRLIVEHTMEAPEAGDTAENVARYFQNPDVDASSHICSDNNSDVRCVPDGDTAWCAPGANHDGLQHEMAGYASQSAKNWNDSYSNALLRRVAKIQAGWAVKYGIPIRKLSVSQVRDGKTKGFCAHDDVSKAFGKSSHWDPGPNFPWDKFLDMVREYANGEAPDDGDTDSNNKIDVDGVWGWGTTTAIQVDLDAPYKDGEISRQNEYWEDDNPGLGGGWEWINRDAAVGGKGSQTIKLLWDILDHKGYDVGSRDGLFGPKFFKGIQRWMKAEGLYDGKIDGEAWRPSTAVKALQRAHNQGIIRKAAKEAGLRG